MKKLILFVLGQKGLSTARACMQPDFLDLVDTVVIGEDKNLKHDCSEDIRHLCEETGTRYLMRKNYSPDSICHESTDADGTIGIASGWRWMISEKFHPLIVIHDSLLPKYRGFNPLVTALLNRDEIVGATALVANMEFDRGNIIESDFTKITYPISIADATTRMADVVFSLTTSVLRRIRENKSLTGVAQDETQASYSVWRDNDDYWIDWSQSSEDIAHFVNCVSYPYAGASTCVDNRVIRILKATPVQDVKIANRHAGKVLFMENDKPVVICGAGLLRIDDAVDEEGNTMLPLPRFRVRFKVATN